MAADTVLVHEAGEYQPVHRTLVVEVEAGGRSGPAPGTGSVLADGVGDGWWFLCDEFLGVVG